MICDYSVCNSKIMKVYIANDHAGYKLKCLLINHLTTLKDVLVVDLGSDSEESVDFPDYAQKLCETLLSDDYNGPKYGILICGSGIGMSIAANRYSKIRCALCNNVTTAVQSREHNNCNVLALGASQVSVVGANMILNAFLTTKYLDKERYNRRLDKL